MECAAQKARREVETKAKEEDCREGEEKEEDVGVHPMTPKQGNSRGHHSLGGC